MVRRLLAGVALASAAALSVAGCGAGDEPEDGPAVAWATKACGVIGQGAGLSVPKVNTADVAASKQAMVKLLGDISVRLKTLSMDMQGLGSPPVAGGEATHAAAMRKLTSTSSAVSTAARNLQTAKVTDEASLKRAIAQVSKAFAAYGDYQGPQQDLRANPALNSAFAKSPTCRAKRI